MPTCDLCHVPDDRQGCVLQRIQYSYWEGWSHGEILFRRSHLKALDQALREQERVFRSPEVTAAVDASRYRKAGSRGGASGPPANAAGTATEDLDLSGHIKLKCL